MPDGDFISAKWLKDLIQTDCNVEDESRMKVIVQETSLPSNLDEAAKEYKNNHSTRAYWLEGEFIEETTPLDIAFKAGAGWMTEQGETHEHYVIREIADHDIGPAIVCYPETFEIGDKVVVQIRKK